MGSEQVTLSAVAFRSGVIAAMHPIEYAKTLIQLGYEPLPPIPTRTLFGKPALGLPSIFKYVSIIRKRDGFFGCYRGLGPRVCATIVSGLAFQKVSESIVFDYETTQERRKSKSDNEDEDEEDSMGHENLNQFLCSLIRSLAARSSAVIVSQPFHVIAIRTMAQFVGQEEQYNGLFSGVREIYNESGVMGFFKGLMPRLTGELLCIIFTSSVSYTLNTYVIKGSNSKGFVTTLVGFISSTLTYPFHVVASCMAVTGSNLAAGQPPYMPIYVNWTDCWSHLAYNNQLKRGSSLLWRYYTGPALILGQSNIQPGNMNQFKRPSHSM